LKYRDCSSGHGKDLQCRWHIDVDM
jgi:hypothetical protein